MSKNITCTANLTKEMYAYVERWNEFFDKGHNLNNIPYDSTWTIMFALIKKDKKFIKVNDKLKEVVKKNKHIKIYPLPSYVFKAFEITPADNVKVVFIGQDPYFNCEAHNGKYVPQAMGLSFSVPSGIKIPSSLENIFVNMIKFGHLKNKPISGNLWYWASQGCLMLNAALTVEDGTKESHIKLWEWMTDYVITYISQHMNGIIFVLWGSYAYKKINLIDLDKHHAIISSHPSGLSAHKPLQEHPAFMNQDHFGKINDILEKSNRTKILWD